MKSAAVIAFDHRPSRLLLAAIAAVLSIAIVAVALSGAVLWLKIVLALAAAAYTAFAVRQSSRTAPRRLAWHEAGHWRIVCGDGEHSAELSGATVRGAWIVLNLRRNDGVRTGVVLAPDNCDEETRRRLRVRLTRANAAS